MIFKESLLWRSFILTKRLAVHDNFVKKLVLKATSTSSVESLYSSCHFCQFTSNSMRDLQGLMQPKNDRLPLLDAKNWHPNSTFFSLPVLSQKQLKMKSLIKNGIIPRSKILTQITLYLKAKLTF